MRCCWRGPLVTGSLIIDDPELAFAMRPGASCVGLSPEFRVHYRTDPVVGLRVDSPASVLPEAPVDAVFYGDSFTFGHGVEEHETFVGRLRQAHPAYRLVNAGMFNYGPDQEYLLAQRLRPRFTPCREVVCLCTGNDLTDMGRFKLIDFSVEPPAQRPAQDPAGATRRRLTALPFYSLLTRFYTWHLLKNLVFRDHGGPAARATGPPGPWEDRDGSRILRLLELWRKQAEPGRLRVVIIPVQEHLAELPPAFAAVVDGLRAAGVPVLDLREALARHTGPPALFYPVDGHFTPEGHAVAAKAIGEWLDLVRPALIRP